MIVRELLTLLGFTVDKASYNKAVKAYDDLQRKMTAASKPPPGAPGGGLLGGKGAGKGAAKAAQGADMVKGALSGALGMLQRFNTTAQLSSKLMGFVEMASSANETQSALGALFGPEGLGQVQAWSEKMGMAMGRNAYDLQAYASRLGSVLTSVTKTPQEAQKMAQSLSELSVDLASFFNTTDEDAMMALRSGLTGEYESLKRYGVVLNDATLQEVANARGIKKKVSQLSIAEKTELRYQAILDRTKAAQGDAIRTGDGFANSTKNLKSQLEKLGTDMAMSVIPHLLKLVRFARDAVEWFNKMAKGSRVLETAFIALAAVAAVLASEFLSAFVLPALAIGALVLLIDELWTTFEGGDTLIRDWLDSWLGAGTTAELVERIKAGVASVLKLVEGLDAIGIWDTWSGKVDDLIFKIERLVKKLIWAAEWLDPEKAWARISGTEGATETQVGRGLNSRVETADETMARRQRERDAAIKADVAVRAERRREHQFGPKQFDMVAAAAGPMIPFASGPLSAPVGGAAGGGAAGGGAGVNLAAPTIVINNGDPVKLERVAKKVMEDERKKTLAAVGQRGRS